MEQRDFIVTPIVILLVYAGAYIIRPYVTDPINRKYFLPGLTVRIVGAITLGFIYQFYYNGGDTFNYHTHGSRQIWEAIMNSPDAGYKLFFAKGEYPYGTYEYASKIYFFHDPASYLVIRLAAFIDLFTFSSYAATAVFFGVISFIGMWLFFLTFYAINPLLHKWFAIAAFFIPSVFFWGSGILKDSITLAALGAATYFFYRVLILKKISVVAVLLLLLNLYVIFVVKKFILQAYFPAVIIWFFADNYNKIRSFFLKLFLVPVVGVVCIYSAYLSIYQVGVGDSRYSLKDISKTARITAYDIRYWSGRDAGSGYSLGELDDSPETFIRLAPQAIVVSLFRPYLWEVNNPLMLLSSLESLLIFITVIYIFIKKKFEFFNMLSNAHIAFCLTFVLIFAFAVGISTSNFGTLVRYKIPLLPFLVAALALISFQPNKDKKLPLLDSTEK